LRFGYLIIEALNSWITGANIDIAQPLSCPEYEPGEDFGKRAPLAAALYPHQARSNRDRGTNAD
jgi:hypothetical protein